MSSIGCKTQGFEPISEAIGFETQNKSRPNILWIIADDLGPDLASFGNTVIYTPHLDSLASTGALYTKFFSVAPVCSVSRSALITGRYPVNFNAHQHRTQFKDSLPKSIETLPEIFRKAGYFVSNTGKTDYNFIHDKKTLFDGKHWRERKNNQPFFAQIQISLPHRPFLTDTLHPIIPEEIQLPTYYPDVPLVRKDWAMYLETIQKMDQQVGKVLSELKQDGLEQNTVVFFFGDQGRPMLRAKQFLYDAGLNTPLLISGPGIGHMESTQLVSEIDISKTTLNLAGIPVPINMDGIDIFKEKRAYVYATRDRMDETVDKIRMIRNDRFKYILNFYPEKPYTQFNSYKKFNYPVLTLMQIMDKAGELTKEQHAFMAPTKPREELYDLLNDPFEVNNVAGDKRYSSVKDRLENQLLKWIDKNDLGIYPEDDHEIEYARNMMHQNYREWMEAEGLDLSISDSLYLKFWERKLQLN